MRRPASAKLLSQFSLTRRERDAQLDVIKPGVAQKIAWFSPTTTSSLSSVQGPSYTPYKGSPR